MTPPCPGRKELMSLIPRSLLIIDSMRSPQVPIATRLTPRMMPTQNGTSRTKMAMQIAAAVANANDPPRPSQDFFGLIFGAIWMLAEQHSRDITAGVAHHHNEQEGHNSCGAMSFSEHQGCK